MGQRIDVKHLNIYYGDFLAVEDVNINIEPNKVTAFIGPSGCGKSTVLRTLDRMHEIIPGAHVKGEVELEGKNLYAKDVDPVAVRRDVGMVFQRPNPFPTMTIRENVLAGVRLNNRRISKSDADDLVEWALKGANLWEEVKDRLDNPGIGLSGGQQQRLCIARAVAVHPQVLLMDEPCSALDPISTLAVEDLINELKGDYTIVIVTHNMQQAARIADYTAFFNLKAVGEPGHLEYFADTTTMFNNPRTPKPSATSPVVSADRRRAGGSHALHPPARPSPQDPPPRGVFAFVRGSSGIEEATAMLDNCRVVRFCRCCTTTFLIVTLRSTRERSRCSRS